ncbi:hypothetical protein [Amycolatopsis australiensis]|uniref:Uncharacterized protein n=1 Tax=Amycolatopsis australiensis TaxID=546364 RepID=A0A1K1S1S4_9PSEU|nr:hypothetical protein [Amycolatopsis australiensis]SFW78013.1 hypothetical protein SAMN04489730_4423 [Amycolatopsis australiensis]
MTSVEAGLRSLVARGFRFQHIADRQGELTIIVGTYGWPGCCDRIEIHGEHEASAVRTSAETVAWSQDGDTLSVIAALLELPPPAEPSFVDSAGRAGSP